MVSCSQESFDNRLSAQIEFWESKREWFIERGYRPFSRLNDEENPTISYPSDDQLPQINSVDSFPYAFLDPRKKIEERPSPVLAANTVVVMFAQDSHSRHIVLKPIKRNSDEHRILRMLHEHKQLLSPVAFSNIHLLPVLGFLHAEDSSDLFVLMPRWGVHPAEPPFRRVHELLDFIHAMLVAVDFLHSRNIVHRDISSSNVLVDVVDLSWDSRSHPSRIARRAAGTLRYALFDFDLSISFPMDATREQCRLPYNRSYQGTLGYRPADTEQGEYDYDPFAWDVASLGMLFCYFAQGCTPTVPMLAPFLDRMVTRNIARRFSISEAIAFFDDIESGITHEQRMARCSEPIYTAGYDKWKGLPADFVAKWESYRESIIPPLHVRLLRRACERQWICLSVIWTRRAFAWFSSKCWAIVGFLCFM